MSEGQGGSSRFNVPGAIVFPYAPGESAREKPLDISGEQPYHSIGSGRDPGTHLTGEQRKPPNGGFLFFYHKILGILME